MRKILIVIPGEGTWNETSQTFSLGDFSCGDRRGVCSTFPYLPLFPSSNELSGNEGRLRHDRKTTLAVVVFGDDSPAVLVLLLLVAPPSQDMHCSV